MTFKINDYVESVTIGSKAGFSGTIVAKDSTGYIIRDAENKRWLRSENEIWLVKGAQ